MNSWRSGAGAPTTPPRLTALAARRDAAERCGLRSSGVSSVEGGSPCSGAGSPSVVRASAASSDAGVWLSSLAASCTPPLARDSPQSVSASAPRWSGSGTGNVRGRLRFESASEECMGELVDTKVDRSPKSVTSSTSTRVGSASTLCSRSNSGSILASSVESSPCHKASPAVRRNAGGHADRCRPQPKQSPMRKVWTSARTFPADNAALAEAPAKAAARSPRQPRAVSSASSARGKSVVIWAPAASAPRSKSPPQDNSPRSTLTRERKTCGHGPPPLSARQRKQVVCLQSAILGDTGAVLPSRPIFAFPSSGGGSVDDHAYQLSVSKKAAARTASPESTARNEIETGQSAGAVSESLLSEAQPVTSYGRVSLLSPRRRSLGERSMSEPPETFRQVRAELDATMQRVFSKTGTQVHFLDTRTEVRCSSRDLEIPRGGNRRNTTSRENLFFREPPEAPSQRQLNITLPTPADMKLMENAGNVGAVQPVPLSPVDSMPKPSMRFRLPVGSQIDTGNSDPSACCRGRTGEEFSAVRARSADQVKRSHLASDLFGFSTYDLAQRKTNDDDEHDVVSSPSQCDARSRFLRNLSTSSLNQLRSASSDVHGEKTCSFPCSHVHEESSRRRLEKNYSDLFGNASRPLPSAAQLAELRMADSHHGSHPSLPGLSSAPSTTEATDGDETRTRILEAACFVGRGGGMTRAAELARRAAQQRVARIEAAARMCFDRNAEEVSGPPGSKRQRPAPSHDELELEARRGRQQSRERERPRRQCWSAPPRTLAGLSRYAAPGTARARRIQEMSSSNLFWGGDR
eukprot:TRINITY_DN10550_c0_g2_i1.p1 TRINITY_DN10550_c0_g2~~TRINITY_DN10550_c0_g2_i1.p1  ORF type:complete len:806 (+),score=82.13 TRINITY_DN10550_c0_g2_i1:66-2483(+)